MPLVISVEPPLLVGGIAWPTEEPPTTMPGKEMEGTFRVAVAANALEKTLSFHSHRSPLFQVSRQRFH
jgi:hypothetical protein